MKIRQWQILEGVQSLGEVSEGTYAPQNMAPLVSKGLVAHDRRAGCFRMTPKGLAVLDSGNAPISKIGARSVDLEAGVGIDPYAWERRVSTRFFEALAKNYPMKGSPTMSRACLDTLKKLQGIDGYTRGQIRRTLDYIASDVREGFCFARNIRTPATLRSKWKNGMTKFSTAYNAMLEGRNGALQESALGFVPFPEAGTGGKDGANAIWGDLITLCPQGNAKGEFLRALGDVCRLFAEFVDRRHWPGRISGMFLEAIKKKAEKGLHFNGAVLVSEAADFLGRYGDSGGRGYYIQQGAMAPDERYRKRLEGFSQDFGDGVGFHEARYEEDRK